MDKLRLNTGFIGFDGIIGRRDYFINVLYVRVINILATIPVMGALLANMENASDAFNYAKLFSDIPILLKVWYIIITAFCFFIFISNAIRRLNDINGKVNNVANTALLIFFILNTISIFLPLPLLCLFVIVNAGIGLFLLFKKGNITGRYPYDFTKTFNWGAFFGTWIWGLFNKSYKTLWMLILGLTPAGLYYALICGLKGNEWAYKNKKWENDEKFKSSQDIQAIVFIILKVVILPIIYLFIIMSLVFVFVTKLDKEYKHNPNSIPPVMEKLGNFMKGYTSLYFESYKIEENENKFFILPKDWAGYSFSDKKEIFDAAATTAAFERLQKQPDKSFTKKTELPRTKIYSSKNGELLGEFSIDNLEDLDPDKVDFKTVMKAAFSAYRFYKPTVK